MLTADTGANSTTTADGDQSMGSEGTDKQQTDAVIQQEVRTSAAALQAATAAPQTPLELAASVATAVPGPHHLPSPAQDQASPGGPYNHLQSMSNVRCQLGQLDDGTETLHTVTQQFCTYLAQHEPEGVKIFSVVIVSYYCHYCVVLNRCLTNYPTDKLDFMVLCPFYCA